MDILAPVFFILNVGNKTWSEAETITMRPSLRRLVRDRVRPRNPADEAELRPSHEASSSQAAELLEDYITHCT